jgi:PAS domain-containing protein
LLAQHGVSHEMQVPEDHPPQPITKGVLGRLVRTGEPQNVGNVAEDEDYLHVVPGVGSELAWPITWGGDGKVRLIVNVEDSHQNAFSENESAWLGVIANEVGALMERIGQTHFLTECFRSASDPILYADAKHVIRHANPAAVRLLSCEDEAQLLGPLQALLEEDAVYRQLSERADAEEVQCRLRTRNPAVPAISVHISRQPLAEEFGGAIYVLRDLRDIQRTVELDLLGQATYEVAMQTKAPLSLAMATLEQCAGRGRGAEARAAETALRHLDRVERGYTRLAMYRGNHEPAPSSPAMLDLGAELRSVAADLRAAPDAPSPVSIDQKVAPPPIRGDHSQVSFILETLLSALVRSTPEHQPVTASFAVQGERLLLDLRGRLGQAAEGTEAVRLGADVRSSLWLARPMIDQFLETHGADLREQRDGDRITYRLSFPAAVPAQP